MPNLPFAVRGLAREPILVLSATLTLAVCIGANTTVFSVANSILIRPLPYPDAGHIDWISERSGPNREEVGAAPDYYRIRDGNRVFQDVAAFTTATLNWTGIERPERVEAVSVSPSFFSVVGLQPILGRYLAPDEEGSKAPPVVVLSYAFWRNRLESDTHVIGRTIALDRAPHTIIGVMPQGFDFPRGAQVWTPLGLDESAQRPIIASRPIFVVSMVARRKPDVSPKEVESDLNRLAYLIRAEYKVFPTKFRWDLTIEARPLQQHLTGPVRSTIVALSGAACLVLLIACVNLANLLLARAGVRQRELAVRLALGAGRRRIVGQALAESVALATPGGLAGVGVAWLCIRFLNIAQPAILTRFPPITMDWFAFGFTLGVTLTASLLFGMAPAISSAGTRVHDALRSAAVTSSGGTGATRLRKILVVAELAGSLVLLIGAGLLTKTLVNLARTELGFRSDHLLTFRATPIGAFDGDHGPFYRAVLDRLQHLPMIQSAAVLLDVPMSDEDFYLSGRIRVAGRPSPPFLERPIVNNTIVSPEFFQTLEIPLKSGRLFDSSDSAPRKGATVTNYGMASPAPVVVNEAFVRRIFPGESPLGRRLLFGPDVNSVTWTVVGVVGNVRGGALGADPPAMIYRCLCDGSRILRAAFAVRTHADPKAAVREVERQVHLVDRDLPIFDVKTMEERRAEALGPEQFQVAVIGSFAGLAILLAAAGVYGVVSYLVTRRTREIGIRVAMGARPANVLGMVLGETMALAAAATGVGLAGAWALTRYLRSMLHGVTELDPAIFGLAPLLLLLIALAACLGPARSAAQLDPMTALRED